MSKIKRISKLLIILFFVLSGALTFFAPTVLADGSYTWTDQTQDTSIANKDWYDISSSASGQYLAGAALNDDIYVSNDYGSTWTDATSSLGAQQWSSVTVSSSGQYMAAVTQFRDVYTSSDYGVTWTPQSGSGSRNWYSVAMSSSGQYLVAVDVGGYIYTSSDYGLDWTQQTSSGTQIWGNVAVSGTGQYMVSGIISGGSLYTSDDYGATWTAESSAGSQLWDGFTASYSGQYMSAVAWTGDVWTSDDYGVTWVDRTTSAVGSQEWENLTASSTGQYIAAAAGYGDIYVSSDYGATWTDITPDSPFTNLYYQGIAYSATGQRLFAAVRFGDLYTANNPSLAPDTNVQIGGTLNSTPVTINTPVGTNVTTSDVISATSLSTKDNSYSFPLGLVNLCFNTVNTDNDVTLTFETNLSPSQVVLRDYNSLTNTYVNIPNATISETTYNGSPALSATYDLVDNGPLDSDSAIGAVCDPIGVATLITTKTNVKPPNTGYGQPKNTSSFLVSVMTISAIFLLVMAVKSSYWKREV